MRVRTLLAALVFLPAGFTLPAAAESSVERMPASETASAAACLAKAGGDRLAQIDCCKGHKGICGCRAGKIVCCDNTTSKEPGCTCHGDEGVVE